LSSFSACAGITAGKNVTRQARSSNLNSFLRNYYWLKSSEGAAALMAFDTQASLAETGTP
jgi:hypothetical protein